MTFVNLLKTDTQKVFEINRWSAVNATIQTVGGLGERMLNLRGTVRSEGINVTSVVAGDVELRSPIFPIPPGKGFVATGIMKIGKTLAGETLSMRMEYFNVNDVSAGAVLGYTGEKGNGAAWVASTDAHIIETSVAATDMLSGQLAIIPFTTVAYASGFSFGNPVVDRRRFWVPEDANYARLIFEVESVNAASLMFAISDVCVVDLLATFATNTFANTYKILPDFIKAADLEENSNTSGHQSLTKKLLSAAYVSAVSVGEELRGWGYTRAEDSVTNTELLSTLTDPQNVSKSYLTWLAQLVGVKLNNPFTGTSMWLSLAGWTDAEDSTTWQNLDVLDEESSEDSVTWQLARSSTYESIDAYRQQIQHAFNGLNAGAPNAMRSYLKTVLDTTTPDNYFTRIKTRYRESPFLVKYVFDPEVDPDPDGTRIETEMAPTLSAGVVGSQSNKPRDAAEFAFEAKDVLEANVPGGGLDKNDETVLKFGNSGCQAIPDVTGSGRHISLIGEPATPKASRYGIIAGARYNTGFAFYPSSIQGSGAHINLAATNTGVSGATDYIFHVGDIKVGSSSSISLFKQGTSAAADHRECEISDTGTLKYHSATGSPVSSTAYSSATHDLSYDFSQPGDRWIRFSVTTTGGSGNGTVSFYVAPTMQDALHPTTYLINTVNNSAAPNVYDNTVIAEFFKVSHDANGIIGYRAIINDGILNTNYLGWGLSTAADLNLTKYTGTTGTSASVIAELYDGIDDFDQDATLNKDANTCQWTVQYEASPTPLSNWIGLPHTGTDYLYIGNQSSAGDSLVVSGMDSDSYNWTVTYTGGTTATGSGTATTFTWAAATYGGKLIEKIDVVGIKTYSFTPSIITTHTENTSTGTDAQSGTWTINRTWESSNDYEFSSIVDKDLYQVNREGGAVAHNLTVGRDTPLSISFHYRRFKDDASADYIFHHRNVMLYFNGDIMTFKLNSQFDASADAAPEVSITWDDSSRKGQWNHVGAVRDVINGKIILYVNGVKVSDAVDTTVNSLAARTGIPEYPATFHSSGREGWQFNHFALFKEALSAADMERVRQTLPT